MTSPTEIDVSLLRLEEAEAVVELAGAIWRAHYPGIITPAQIEYMLAQRYKPGLIKQLIARGDLWLAARAQGELIGFAHGHPVEDGDYKLDKLYVHSGWQRHGIGGKLIGEVVKRAQGRGFTRLVLRVNRQNHPAIHAYLKHGFQVVTLIDEEIGGGFAMNDYILTMVL